jgi:hypothetical protein
VEQATSAAPGGSGIGNIATTGARILDDLARDGVNALLLGV